MYRILLKIKLLKVVKVIHNLEMPRNLGTFNAVEVCMRNIPRLGKVRY